MESNLAAARGGNLVALDAEWVLVDGDDLGRRQERLCLVGHLGNVAACASTCWGSKAREG